MASCFNIRNSSIGVEAFDCINGSVLDKGELSDLTNFTYLSYLHVAVSQPVKAIAPLDLDLTVSNESKLMVNLEGCVNTLRDECKEFLREFGKDGTDHNARARFPCFYSKDNIGVVVSAFDLETTYKQFLFASLVPSVLFIISCTCLVLCQRTVHVGDDAKMRFMGCNATETLIESKSMQDNLGGSGAGGGEGSVKSL